MMIIKINCKEEEFTDYIEIMDSDKEKIIKVLKNYKKIYEEGKLTCSYTDFLDENRIWFKTVEFETIEI